MKTKLFLLLLVFTCFSSMFATTYYSKSTGNLNVVGTWGTNTNGTGTAPANFTTAGNTFIIVNNTAATIAANWTVSGTGSVIQVGDGTQTINFTIPTAFKTTGTINVTNHSTLTINNATNPTLGTLASGSTVVYSDAAAQPVLNATYYNLTLGGSGTKTLANTASSTITNSLTINSGIAFQLSTNNTYTLTLNGTLSGAGTITGGNASNLTIGGSGSFGTIIPTASPLTINNFIINRASLGSITLGGNVSTRSSCNFSNGVININGNTLTLNGTLTFPAASTNGTITGSATSNLSIGAASIANNLFMTSGAQTLNNLTLASTGQTLTLGNDLTVSGAYTQTRGIVNINGHTLTLGGTATFASSAANGTTTGSSTSNLIITATTITNSLFMTTGAQTLNNLTLNSAGKTLTLGTALTVSGAYTQTNGIVKLNGQILTLSGAVTFPAVSTNGTITGTTASDLIVNATSITNDLFMTAASTTLRNLTLNCAGQTLTLGSALTVSGAFTQTNGIVSLNGQTLTLSGTIVFPAASSNGTITGSSTSNISITATNITNSLYMTSGAQTLNNLTLNATAGKILTLGTDLTVSGAYTQTKGIVSINGHTLTLSGTATFATTVANGTTTGSTTSNLIITATTITNSLFMTVGSQTLNNFTLNSAGKTLTLGTALTVSGAYTQTNGIVKLNAQTLTLTGVIIFPAASTNGTITGSTTSNLSVSGTSITNTLFFTTGALTLNNFTVNSSSSQTLKLGTALTLSGTFTHTNGIIDLNGQALTCNGPVIFPAAVTNGSFTGSSTSSFSITTPAGGAITNSMFMTQTNSSTNSLKNITLNRTSGTLTLGNHLNLIGALIPTVGTFASAGNLTLVASSATVTAYIGTIGGSVTGNVTVQAYEAGATTGWTLMGSPGLTGRTMADWGSNFYVTCASCPDGDGTAQNGSAFTSITAYSETAGGLMSDAPRYINISSITDPINVAQGYWVYLGDGPSTTNDIVLSMTGPVKQGNVSIPLTITNIGAGTAATDHGYNLIANPYPAPISWTSLRAGNGSVSATIYVYNPDLNAYSTFISTSGVSSPAVGAGGIGDKIPAGQGFYVKASAATTLTAKETFKAASSQQLLRLAHPANNTVQDTSSAQHSLFRLQASGNSMNNETVIYFDPNATVNYSMDYDAISLGVDPGFLGIVTELHDTAYTIKGLPPLTQNISIPIKTTTSITGSYQIKAADLQNLPSGACIKLHDNYMNTDWDLRTGPYNCTLNDTETVARFSVNITIDPSLSVSGNSQNPTCAASTNGYMVANASGAAPWNYYWKDANNNIIKTSLNKTTADTLHNATSGNYSVDINTVGSCNNGTINFTLQGSMSASAAFTPSATLDSLINDTVSIYFTNNSTNASSYLWDFGDGTQDNVTSTYHTYTSPGTYTIALAAYDNVCGDTSVYYQVITIDTALAPLTSGIKSLATIQNGMQISRDATGYYVQFNYQTKTNATISVQNLLGEKVTADIKQENVSNNKTYISLGNTENNVLIISVNTSSDEKTFRKVINY